MKCPKCSGKRIPAPEYGINGERCLNCGWIKLGDVCEVAMPQIPQYHQPPLSSNPKAAYNRDYRRGVRISKRTGSLAVPETLKVPARSDKRRRLTAAEEQYILDAYAANVSYENIALAINRSMGTICSFMNRHRNNVATEEKRQANA